MGSSTRNISLSPHPWRAQPQIAQAASSVGPIVSSVVNSLKGCRKLERMSQQEHGVAGLALKSADIPENPHERARDVYHLKIAGWALGPIRRRHDALLARGSLGTKLRSALFKTAHIKNQFAGGGTANTTPGRARIAAGFETPPVPVLQGDFNLVK